MMVVAFDADDTLWHNEPFFYAMQDRFQALLKAYQPDECVIDRLEKSHIANLQRFGYGVKGFVFSMIETALEATQKRITPSDIQTLLDYGKEMMDHPVELLDGVEECLRTVGQHHSLMLVTKGDLFHQESKLARSGVADFFSHIEVVSEKDDATYARLLRRHNVSPSNFAMIGNSVKSDVLPPLRLGAKAAHIPYATTWAHERVEDPGISFPTLSSMADVPGWLQQLTLR